VKANIPMPKMGKDMEGATLVEWCRQPGDRVERGQLLARATYKVGGSEAWLRMVATIGIEAIGPGVVEGLLASIDGLSVAPEGTFIAAGEIIAQVDYDGDVEPPGYDVSISID
jgi:hypothetical protein